MTEFDEDVARRFGMNRAQWDAPLAVTNGHQALMLDTMAQYVREQVAPLRKRIDELEADLGERKFCGPWQEGVDYKKHNETMYGGSCWVCMVGTTGSKPSTDNPAWSLKTKRGRDGRRGLSVDELDEDNRPAPRLPTLSR